MGVIVFILNQPPVPINISYITQAEMFMDKVLFLVRFICFDRIPLSLFYFLPGVIATYKTYKIFKWQENW